MLPRFYLLSAPKLVMSPEKESPGVKAFVMTAANDLYFSSY